MVDVFISHAHADEKIVGKLVRVLEDRFHFDEKQLRCTSHPRYGIKYGEDPVDILKTDLKNVKVLLPIFTPNSISNPWFNAEIGAAWVLSPTIIPILTGSLKWNNIAGPIFGRPTTFSLREKDQLLQLLTNIRDICTWKEKIIPGTNHPDTKRYEQSIQDLLVESATPSVSFPSERLLHRSEMFLEANRLRWIDIQDFAKEEVYIWGWSCVNSVTARNRHIFKEIIKRIKHLRFLVLSPKASAGAAEHLNMGIICNRETTDVTADIKNAFSNFQNQLLDKLEGSFRRCVEVRMTDWLMSWSGVAIDPEHSDGVLQVEFYQYGNPTGSPEHLDARPNLVLTRQSRFFDGFWGSIKAMWLAATPHKK